MSDPTERTVVVDLDGTLAEYHGWTGEFTPIGPPIVGANGWTARAFCEQLQKHGFIVLIWSVRGDVEKIAAWLQEHQIPYDGINCGSGEIAGCSAKPPAAIYLDDRAVGFRGDFAAAWDEMMDIVIGGPWWEGRMPRRAGDLDDEDLFSDGGEDEL